MTFAEKYKDKIIEEVTGKSWVNPVNQKMAQTVLTGEIRDGVKKSNEDNKKMIRLTRLVLIIAIATLLLVGVQVFILFGGNTGKYDKCVEACQSTYPSYVGNEDYINCKQGCINKYK